MAVKYGDQILILFACMIWTVVAGTRPITPKIKGNYIEIIFLRKQILDEHLLKQDWIPLLKLSAEFWSTTNIAYIKIVRKTSLELINL